jgi:hypothetical protein
MKNQDLFAKLQGLGFSKTQSGSVSMPVIMVLDGQSYLDQPVITYSVKAGKKGPTSGKGKK